jgi:cysteinyl-tRNA synthetase
MKVYNTLTGQKEEFLPLGREVRMYVCGVTPYDNSHLGHAMSYIIFDVVRRYLKYRGYMVKYVQNVTDIDDKIINRANQLGIQPSELAEKFTQSFFEDMKALNVTPADVYPRATQEIPKILEVIQGLVAKRYAYSAKGSVYFRVRKLEDYGKLAHRTLDSMMAGARIESGEEKEHPMDFVIWKGAKPGEPEWESPWGPGRPGWHIECSAMSLKYLGEQIDIHGGGSDLIFPHHENEIAQSESFTGRKPFVKFWMHNGLLQLGEEKMSKSLGNILTIKSILGKFNSDTLRLFVLSGHYRSPITFSEEALNAAGRGVERIRQAAYSESKIGNKKANLSVDDFRQRFIDAMDDDFNSPQAVALLFDLVKHINKLTEEGTSAIEEQKLLFELSGVLGLTLKVPEKNIEASPFIELLILTRKQLREAKQYQLADNIRAKLDEMGIALEDTPTGTIWRMKS